MWEASFHDCSTGPVSLGLDISSQEVLTLTSICILIRECLDGWALRSGPVLPPAAGGKARAGIPVGCSTSSFAVHFSTAT